LNTDDTRSEVDADRAAIQRVLSRALQETDRGRPFARWSRVLVTIVMIAFLGVGLWSWAFRSRQSPGATTLTITGSRTLIVAERGDGRRWVVAQPVDRRMRGSYVIVVER
jgi:hypothetical protein